VIKQRILLFVYTFFFFSGYSQVKLGLWEREHLKSIDDSQNISVLFKGSPSDVEELLVQYKGTLKYHYGNVGAITLPKIHLNDFLNQLQDIQIEVPTAQGHLMMDTSLIINNIYQVHDGTAPLNRAYTGKGVIVGILDSGIYFDHVDFKNPDGTTRIRYIWDQRANSSINPPVPYGFGQEWSWIDINNGSCTHVEPANQFGHGTTVAGAACGNGLANGLFKGVAPESELIVVGVNLQSNFLSNVADAVDYVFKKADALGKPCVINTSVGTYFGSHDGKDLTSQIIDALLEERSGRAVVGSAGNANNIGNQDSGYRPFHLGYEVTSDTAFTWFRRIASVGQVYFDLWADTADFNNVNFAIGNNNDVNYTLISATTFMNILTDFPGNLEAGVYKSIVLLNPNNSNNEGLIEIQATQIDSRYRVEFLITPTTDSHMWRFITTGSGTFDIWSSQTYQGTSNMVFQNLPPDFMLPEIVNYKAPDTRKTIVSSWQCSDKVITVGNYYNRAGYYDVDSTYRTTGYTVGKIAFRSSEGPTRDNRLKPDICATGDLTFATGNLTFIASALNSNRSKVAPGALHNSNGGTSMSSPVVAGAVALYLEKNPNAWWYESKQVLINTVVKDTFTGPTANNQYGHGKLHGLDYLGYNTILGCTDSTAFNFDANANIDDRSCEPIIEGCTEIESLNFNPEANTNDGSCIPMVYGCTDSLASNYNANANTEDGTCEYPVINSIAEASNKEYLNLYPNPMKTTVTIDYKLTETGADIKVVLYDILGKKVLEKQVAAGQGKIQIHKKTLESGIYLLRFELENKPISTTKKLIVQ
jgi:subtilisin family serine protease